MSNLGAIFVRLVGQAADYTRMYCVKCDSDQSHQLITAPTMTTVSRPAEYWSCVRCGNVQNWKMP